MKTQWTCAPLLSAMLLAGFGMSVAVAQTAQTPEQKVEKFVNQYGLTLPPPPPTPQGTVVSTTTVHTPPSPPPKK